MLRSLKSVNSFVNRLNDSEYKVDLSSDDYKYMCRTYDTYAFDLKLYVVPESTSIKDKFIGMFFFMNNIRKNFDKIFKRTVESVPGLRMYLLTHVVFDIGDDLSYDWFIKIMLEYLSPTEEEISEFYEMNLIPADLDSTVDMNLYEYIPDFDDEVLIRIGIWRRDKEDRLAPPLEVIETDKMDSLIVNKLDVKKIIDGIKIIDLSVIE